MPRDCDCAGPCGPQEEEEDGVTRREFITLAVGVGAAGALPARAARAPGEGATPPVEGLARWRRALHEPAPPRVYASDVHTDARFPLGGIGTGNVEIGADGQLTTWQLFNTLRDGYVPLFFGVRVGQTARLLQTGGGPPGWPRVPRIEMTGEYPVAVLRVRDPGLPAQVEMTAFTPFAPLDTRASSLPAAAFVFRVHNPTGERQTVSLGAFAQNPVGYDALGPAQTINSVGFNAVAPRLGTAHPNFGGNVNETCREGRAHVLLMRSEPGDAPTLDRPVRIYTSANPDGLNTFAVDRPAGLTVAALDRLPAAGELADALLTVLCLEDAQGDLAEPSLRAARYAVRAGATLVFAGSTSSLLEAYAQATGGRPLAEAPIADDIVWEDFEGGYDRWAVEGGAFGAAPARGALPGQQPVSGFRGAGLVNSFAGGDAATGRMTSRPFVIERPYIRFLIGGGNHRATQIRLVVDGKVARAQAGKRSERLLPALWDVRELRGQTARIEIVDEQKGPWGHISVDQIEFGDLPAARAALDLLDELLPVRFAPAGGDGALWDRLWARRVLREGAAESAGAGGSRLAGRPVGQGRVLLLSGPLMDPADAPLIGARQRAYARLCEQVGARYVAPGAVPARAPGSRHARARHDRPPARRAPGLR